LPEVDFNKPIENDGLTQLLRWKLKPHPFNRRPSVMQNSPQITAFGIIVDPIPPRNNTIAAITKKTDPILMTGPLRGENGKFS
jgi:hypothetical protein